MIAALIVQPEGTAEIRDIEPNLDTLKGIVGGWLEAINGDGWHAYVDEEGKMKNLPYNEAGTAFAMAHGWPGGDMLCGPVVFLGQTHNGDEADVPPSLVGQAVRVWGLEETS